MNKKIGNVAQICSARRVLCTDAKEDGVRLIEISNGILNFSLLESNALDIAQLFYKGMNASFISRNGFVSKELPFLNYFPAGMLYTCGPDCIGGCEGHPTHGVIHHLPAKIENISCTEEGVSVTGETRFTALFGEGISLRRTVSVKAGEAKISLHDELFNDNFRDEQYAILYHINVGYPMLDAGCTIEGDIASTEPRDEVAAKLMDTCLVVEEPVPNAGEACFFHNMSKDRPEISVVNRNIGRKFTVRYNKETLPEITEWKGLQCGDFVIGLEPSTTKLDNITYRTIKAGEKICFDVEIEISEL
ncbi:MAG: DUF4432 family protein [Ruminococcaceae bacterium]|nr:DUF4432 family protein [Oscillospiraceae bacterium]